jgi:tRNA 2-thiouridine synthesizing protein A
MANEVLNCEGMKCPQPVLKVAAKAPDMKPGDTLDVIADCSTFEKDIKMWCDRMKKTLLWVRDEGGAKKRAQIQF